MTDELPAHLHRGGLGQVHQLEPVVDGGRFSGVVPVSGADGHTRFRSAASGRADRVGDRCFRVLARWCSRDHFRRRRTGRTIPLDPENTSTVMWVVDPVEEVDDCSGMIPPARTNTGMRLRGTDTVVVIGPVKVAPVKKSTQRPGGIHTVVSATLPGVGDRCHQHVGAVEVLPGVGVGRPPARGSPGTSGWAMGRPSSWACGGQRVGVGDQRLTKAEEVLGDGARPVGGTARAGGCRWRSAAAGWAGRSRTAPTGRRGRADPGVCCPGRAQEAADVVAHIGLTDGRLVGSERNLLGQGVPRPPCIAGEGDRRGVVGPRPAGYTCSG